MQINTTSKKLRIWNHLLISQALQKPYAFRILLLNSMNKFDIEFYNGLMKGIVKCAGIVRKSANLEEANGKIEGLLGRIQEKIDVTVEESLQ